MTFFSVAISAVVLLLLTEQAHTRPAITATPTATQAGCEFLDKFFKPGEVIFEEICSVTVCTDYGVQSYNKECYTPTPAGK